MAEAENPQSQPAQGTQGQAPAAQSTPASTPSTEPEYFKHIPEQYREEAKKSYLLHSDYTKKTQELAEQRRNWESEQQKYKDYESRLGNYDKWWNENSRTIEMLQKNWDKIQPILMGQAAPNNQNGDPKSHFADYDILPPEEQAKRVSDYVQSQIAAQRQADKQEYAQALAAKEIQLQNYLAVLTDAFERKARDPSLDIPSFIKKATEYSSGQFNPLEAAYHSMTDAQKLEEQKKQWWEQAKEEGRLEERNSRQSPGAFQGSGVPNFKTKPQSRDEITSAIRKLSIDKGFGWGT